MYRYDQSQQSWFMEVKIYTDATTEEVSLQISSWDLFNTYIPYHLWNFEDG